MMIAKRSLLLIVAVLGLPCTLLGAFVLYKSVLPRSHILTSISPGRTYAITLTGQSDRPAYPAVVHKVWFSVTKNEKPFLAAQYLHSGDWLDPSFEVLYPQQTWLSENIIHFYREEYFQRGKPPIVAVANNSGGPIKYLKVASDDTYLLFDLRPGSETTITVSPPRGDFIYLSVEGEFSDNTRIEKREQSFEAEKKSDQPPTYRVSIVDAVPLIERSQLKR